MDSSLTHLRDVKWNLISTRRRDIALKNGFAEVIEMRKAGRNEKI